MDRERKVLYNILSNVVVQFVVAVSGFLIPRFILSAFGSEVNGLVNSIGQFLTYAGLLEMGIGNAAIVSLYVPLAHQDIVGTNIIVSTAKRKYIKSGIIYILVICILAVVYPFIIREQFDYDFIFSMVIIIACTSVVDFFFLSKYKILLMANQRNYVVNFTKAVATIFLTIISCILLNLGYGIFGVKLLAVIVHLCEGLYLCMFVRYQYPNVSYSEKEQAELKQQNNSLIHQIGNVIIYNTDLIVLTMLLPKNSLKEVSVYTVYALANTAIVNALSCLFTGIDTIFGNMVARGEQDKLRENFDIYEYVYKWSTFLCYVCFFVLIIPFVNCYTKGVHDVNYIRPTVAVLFGLNGLIACLKNAHVNLINAYGLFKQTQIFVIAEAIVNIVISVGLVRIYGVEGVLIGTLISHFITTFGISWYIDKYTLNRDYRKTIINSGSYFIIMFIIVFFELIMVRDVNTWGKWVETAIICLVINVLCMSIWELLFHRRKFVICARMLIKMLHLDKN